MEEQEELQILIQFKKGIFHSQIRKKKVKLILSEKRRKDQEQYQQCSNCSIHNKTYFKENGQIIFEKLHQKQFTENLIDIKSIFYSKNMQYIEEAVNSDNLLRLVLSMLSNIDIKNEKVINETLFILTNITYYNKSEKFFQELVDILFINCYKCSIMVKEGNISDSSLNLYQLIAFQYKDNIKLIEYLISISNNLIFQENNYLYQVVLSQQSLISTIVEIFQQKLYNFSLLEDVIHLIYNLSRQNEFYEFSQMNDYLYLIYQIFLLVDNMSQRHRLIQSLSFILDTSSQQEFEDFVTENELMFSQFHQFIDLSVNETKSIQDEQSIQMILEIFLNASDTLKEDSDSSYIKKIIWESSMSIFKLNLQNTEITTLSLKIMQSIMQNNINNQYFVNNLLENQKQQQKSQDEDEQSFFALKQIILQSCEWNNYDTVNELVSLMYIVIMNINSLNQINLLLRCGIIYIFLEALKTDFLYYEVKDNILKSFIQLLNLIDKFSHNEEQIQCLYTQKYIKIYILQHEGLHILENYQNQKITQKTSEMIQYILDELDQDNVHQ